MLVAESDQNRDESKTADRDHSAEVEISSGEKSVQPSKGRCDQEGDNGVAGVMNVFAELTKEGYGGGEGDEGKELFESAGFEGEPDDGHEKQENA